MADARTSEVSDEQAAEALRILSNVKSEPESDGVVTTGPEDNPITLVPEETPGPDEKEAPVETQEAPQEEPVEETAEPEESDDVAALKARNEELLSKNEALVSQAKRSLNWGKQLGFKKAAEADQLRNYLRGLMQKDEIDRAEIERVLGGQIQPAQPQPTLQYPATQPQVQPQAPTVLAEDPDEVNYQTQMFLLDNPMTSEEASAFENFIKTSPNAEEAIVPGNTYATLSRFHKYFAAEHSEKSKTMAKAAKSVKKVQTKAMRAAGPISGRGSPSPTPETPKDFRQMSVKEIEETPNLLSELFRRTIED